MVAVRCPTPSPAAETAHSQMNVEAPMEMSANNTPTTASTSPAAATASKAIGSGIGGSGGTPEVARTLLGLAAQRPPQVGATSTMASVQPQQQGLAGSDEESVCKMSTEQEGRTDSSRTTGTSTKRPREEANPMTVQQQQQQQQKQQLVGGDSEQINSNNMAAGSMLDTSEERPAKKHSPVVHRLLQHPGQTNNMVNTKEKQNETKDDDEKNLEAGSEEKNDGYGPGGGFIGPTMMENGQQVVYQPKSHEWPNHADAIAAAAAELDREDRMGGIGTDGVMDDRFNLLGNDDNEIHLHEEDSILFSKRDGQSSPAKDNVATEKYEEESDGDDDSSPLRPVPFRVPEKVPRYGFVHQLQQNQHRELELQQSQPRPQLEQQHSHVHSSPMTTASRPATSRMLSSAPPLASSRNDDEEGRDDAVANSSPSLQRQYRPQSANTVPTRYGAGRAVVQPFGNSGVGADNIGDYGGGGGESYRGLSDNDAVFGDEDDEEDLYHGSASFDQDRNYYGPTVPRSREEEKKDEDDANRTAVATKLDTMFVSAGSQMPIGVDVPGMGCAGSIGGGNESMLSSHNRIDLQARPQPKTKGKTGPRKKVARKTQRTGIDVSSLGTEEIVPRPRRTRKLRIPQKRIDIILALANFRRNVRILSKVEDVTTADIPAIVTSLVEPFLAERRSRNLLLYLTCTDLAQAAKISKNFHFWVQRETSYKALEFKGSSSLAWEVVDKKNRVHSADYSVKNNVDLTMNCATSLRGDDEKWGSVPTHMDAIEKVVDWCGGWLQFLHARENGAKPQPRSPTDLNKTTLGIHKGRGGVLPQAAVIFDLHRDGKWIWSGIRPISKDYLDRSTNKKDGLLRIYPFSENTRGQITDLDSPPVFGSDESKRAGCFLLSTPFNDHHIFTLSASLASEVSAETLIHSVNFKPRSLCRSLDNERAFYSYASDHWNIGEGSYYNERLVAWSDDGYEPHQCCMYVSPDQSLVTYCPVQKKVDNHDFVFFNHCFWLDSLSQNRNPFFHMMSELVCEKEVIYEMFLNSPKWN